MAHDCDVQRCFTCAAPLPAWSPLSPDATALSQTLNTTSLAALLPHHYPPGARLAHGDAGGQRLAAAGRRPKAAVPRTLHQPRAGQPWARGAQPWRGRLRVGLQRPKPPPPPLMAMRSRHCGHNVALPVSPGLVPTVHPTQACNSRFCVVRIVHKEPKHMYMYDVGKIHVRHKPTAVNAQAVSLSAEQLSVPGYVVLAQVHAARFPNQSTTQFIHASTMPASMQLLGRRRSKCTENPMQLLQSSPSRAALSSVPFSGTRAHTRYPWLRCWSPRAALQVRHGVQRGVSPATVHVAEHVHVLVGKERKQVISITCQVRSARVWGQFTGYEDAGQAS